MDGYVCEDFDCRSESAKKEDESGFNPRDAFYKTYVTEVSKFLAFDWLRNLKIRTHTSFN